MCKQLHDLQQRNRLKQTGLLRRYGATCYGKQETLDDIKTGKAEKYQQLKRSDPEYEEWFLKYSPMEHFEHAYNPKKHKLTVKRSPNAKSVAKSHEKSVAKSHEKSVAKSHEKSVAKSHAVNASPAKTKKANKTNKTKKTRKTLINKLFKIII
jgi:hypothetical protein